MIVNKLTSIKIYPNQSIRFSSQAGYYISNKVFKIVFQLTTFFILSLLPLSSASTAQEEYLIITRDMFVSSLAPLIVLRTNDGLSVSVITLNEIQTSANGSDIQEKIRNTIKERYYNFNAQYVLLVGDVDADDNPGETEVLTPTVLDKEWEMPIRYVYHPTDNYQYIPTDMYYSALDGSWDEDNDMQFGEKKTDTDLSINIDEVDWIPEVAIGRIPAQTVTQVENYIEKVIAFESKNFQFSDIGLLEIQAFFQENYTDSGIWGKILYNFPGYDVPTVENITNEIRSGQYPWVTFTGHAVENGWSVSDGLWQANEPFNLTASTEQNNSDHFFPVNNLVTRAQSFKAKSTNIKEVQVNLRDLLSEGGSGLTVTIRSSLDGPDLSSKTLSHSELNLGWNTFDLPDISLAMDEVYYIVISAPTTISPNFYEISRSTNGEIFTDGKAYIFTQQNPDWTETDSDITFRIMSSLAESPIFFNYISACLSAYIDKDNQQSTIAEDLLFKKNSGSIGYIGALRLSTRASQNSLWNAFWTSFLEDRNNISGVAYQMAQRKFFINFVNFINNWYDTYRFTQFTYIFLGDPYLKFPSIPNNGPVINSIPNGIMAAFGQEYIFNNSNKIEADATGNIMYQKLQGPSEFSISSDGYISWVPPTGGGGEFITVRITDDNGWTDLSWFVQPTDFTNPSYLSINSSGNPQTPVDTPYSYDSDNIPDLHIHDANRSGVTWKKLSGPRDFSIDSQSGLITWAPDKVGQYDINLAAYSGDYGISLHQFSVEVIVDECPDDPQKYVPGICGCGVADTDTDEDGIADCDDPDDDNDDILDDAEISAQSNPLDRYSIPGPSGLQLKIGYNQLSFPAETMYYGDLQTLMEALGGPAVIEKVQIFERDTQQYIEAEYVNSVFEGTNLTLPAGQGLQGLVICARQDHSVNFTSQYCHTWDLRQGINLVGSGGCIPAGLTAQQLLADPTLGAANVSSIQRFNPETGEFETRGFDDDGNQHGIDFTIIPGEGYLLHMKQAVPDFRP